MNNLLTNARRLRNRHRKFWLRRWTDEDYILPSCYMQVFMNLLILPYLSRLPFLLAAAIVAQGVLLLVSLVFSCKPDKTVVHHEQHPELAVSTNGH